MVFRTLFSFYQFFGNTEPKTEPQSEKRIRKRQNFFWETVYENENAENIFWETDTKTYTLYAVFFKTLVGTVIHYKQKIYKLAQN